MPPQLPRNVLFLEGALGEYKRIEKEDPTKFQKVWHALDSLGRHGPPADTRLFVTEVSPFPNTLAFRFECGALTIVFETDVRVVLQTTSGAQVIRAVRGARSANYMIWAIVATAS